MARAFKAITIALLTLSQLSALTLYSKQAVAVGFDDLPDIGSSATAALSIDDEYRIGLSALHELRATNQILEDPEVTQYIDTLGHRLASDAQDGNHRFQFFVLKDPTINAFAYFGGFIFVYSGLILETRNESELAGVVAHEISHVTQRHLVRSVLEQRKNSMLTTAAMLAAIVLGAAAHGGSDAAMASIAGAQTLALGQQMSFSRDMESEADRVGIAVLAQAGFDPAGMSNFFETLASHSGGKESQVPAIVLSHPVSSERVAESRARAAKYPGRAVTDSLGYALIRERLRVFSTPAGSNPVAYYRAVQKNDKDAQPEKVYGKAIALMNSEQPAQAIPLLQSLCASGEKVAQYRIALAQAQSLAGDHKAAIASFEQASKLFPRDVALTVHFADALMLANQPQRAHEILLDLFNTVTPTPEQARQIAFAANAAGNVADAYGYMAEFHLMNGDLSLAANQLQLALAVPKLTPVQRERFRARLDEIRLAMPRRLQRTQQIGGSR